MMLSAMFTPFRIQNAKLLGTIPTGTDRPCARLEGADCELTLFLWVYRFGPNSFISLDSIVIRVVHITTSTSLSQPLPDPTNYALGKHLSLHAIITRQQRHPIHAGTSRNPTLFLLRYGTSVIALFVYVLLISKPCSL